MTTTHDDCAALPAPSTAELERALEHLVSETLAYRRRADEIRAEGIPPALVCMSFTQLMVTPAAILDERNLATDPVNMALKWGIRRVGKAILKRTGSTDGLLAVAERVAKRDPSNYGRRISLMDHTFDGLSIGKTLGLRDHHHNEWRRRPPGARHKEH